MTYAIIFFLGFLLGMLTLFIILLGYATGIDGFELDNEAAELKTLNNKNGGLL